MQYYFARTGLLDGKGAQLAKEAKQKAHKENEQIIVVDPECITPPLSTDGTSVYECSTLDALEQAPSHGSGGVWSEPMMLAPTVSTYKHKETYLQPLPDMPVLRRELRESLDDARKVLEEAGQHETREDDDEGQGWFEIQGLHILDIVTLAIRAAKNYYTTHIHPQKLYAIRTEKQIRYDLYRVMDILKRAAGRQFRGGVRKEELQGMLDWIESIHNLLSQEEEQEELEERRRNEWQWREGDWQGREREREWLFLKSFDTETDPLPTWTDAPEDEPSEFLLALQNGIRLVTLHNELVRRSKRQFDLIKTWHTDTAKPYRCAENLRYWIKAAELRWEVKLSVPVLDVVTGKNAAAWKQFDEAIMTWCRTVREELVGEWVAAEASAERRPSSEVSLDDDNARASAFPGWV